MLKPLRQPTSSPALSPRFHQYAISSPQIASPTSRSVKKSHSQATLPKVNPPQVAQYVDVGTQWSPMMSSKTGGVSPTKSTLAEVQNVKQPGFPPADLASSSKAVAQIDSPTMKRRQFGDVNENDSTSSVGKHQASTPKRAKATQNPVKILPTQYEFCKVEDMVVLIANMISELIETNDSLPLRTGVLTRFHSRTPPGISVIDYLQRLAKHATLTPPLLLSMVYYIDRLCSLYPAFTITTLTVHRFLITAATVAAKGLSDSFWNNATYARVGGIKISELALLELEFLYRVDWRIVPNPEVLIDYYRGLVDRSVGYELESDGKSTDDEDEELDDAEESIAADGTVGRTEGARDVQWRAWMEDVSTRKAENDDSQDHKET